VAALQQPDSRVASQSRVCVSAAGDQQPATETPATDLEQPLAHRAGRFANRNQIESPAAALRGPRRPDHTAFPVDGGQPRGQNLEQQRARQRLTRRAQALLAVLGSAVTLSSRACLAESARLDSTRLR